MVSGRRREGEREKDKIGDPLIIKMPKVFNNLRMKYFLKKNI